MSHCYPDIKVIALPSSPISVIYPAQKSLSSTTPSSAASFPYGPTISMVVSVMEDLWLLASFLLLDYQAREVWHEIRDKNLLLPQLWNVVAMIR